MHFLIQVFGEVLPFLYIMMPNKNQARYTEAFRAVADIEPRFSPENWMSDFERAVLNTVSEVIICFMPCSSKWN